MAKSLQDQLRQSGLASHKQAVKARKAKDSREKQQRKGQAVPDETAEIIKQKEAEKLARDRALNEERNQAAQARAIEAQIIQLIDMNAITERGDTEFRYTHESVISTLMLTDPVRQALIKGQLALVGRQGKVSVVPAAVARKIAERDAHWLILLNESDEHQELDDEYAEYQVPDDLMW